MRHGDRATPFPTALPGYPRRGGGRLGAQRLHRRDDHPADRGTGAGPGDFDELPNNPTGENRFLAAVQAGTPPDIWRVYDYQTQYWRIQSQTADITDLVRPFANQSGGYWQPVELTCAYQGKWWAVPMAV